MAFPKVRLVGLGQKTSSGKVVNASLLWWEIYKTASEKDKELFDVPSLDEIKDFIKSEVGEWFVIENAEGKIVGATSTSFENFARERIVWKLFSSGFRGWIGRSFILRQFRGQGFAGASKLEIEKMAKARGVERLYSLIGRKHKDSQRAIQKAGFEYDRRNTWRFFPLNFIIPPQPKQTWRTIKTNWYQVFSKRIDLQLKKARRKNLRR